MSKNVYSHNHKPWYSCCLVWKFDCYNNYTKNQGVMSVFFFKYFTFIQFIHTSFSFWWKLFLSSKTKIIIVSFTVLTKILKRIIILDCLYYRAPSYPVTIMCFGVVISIIGLIFLMRKQKNWLKIKRGRSWWVTTNC